MDPTDFADRVRSAVKTELSRLGSSKSLYADTEGEMEPDAVLATVADTAHHAAATFEGWGGPFEAAAAGERERYEAVSAELDGHEPGAVPAVVAALDGASDGAERRGAAAGYALVAGEKAGQATGFFTGQADPQTASLFRGIRGEYEDLREQVVEGLDEGDADPAVEAAVAVVEAAYDEYVDRLESMGVNPKPVC
jgi:hypothetical protein